jgi:hypothetical protein
MFSWNNLATLRRMDSNVESAMNRTLGAWEMRLNEARGVNDQTAVQHLLITALSMPRTKHIVMKTASTAFL